MKPTTKKYFEGLEAEIKRTYDYFKKARAKGVDPSNEIEALPAEDLATRVEGLVGPTGVRKVINELGRDNICAIIDWLLRGVTPQSGEEQKTEAIDQAVRTSLAILTEGVVAAPLEGISKVKIRSNPDSSQYLSLYFSGPIRSAGGTAQGLAVLIGEYIRIKLGLAQYRPTRDEVERYVEEIKLYNERVSRLQYLPKDDDIRLIVEKAGVCVDGDPTERIEVAIHRDLKRVESNRIRSGLCLVIAEGLAQKARKLMGYANSMSLDYSFLSEIGKKKSQKNESENEKVKAAFMQEIVGGRPIFSGPSAKGGFRLQYGRCRDSGLAAKCIHPAAQILLNRFPATGTQLKIERPGKGAIVAECTEIEAPVVRLKSKSVVRVETREKALEVEDQVEEILFLGDILVSYGDFLQTNTRLLPAGYCDKWWSLHVKEKNVETCETPTPSQAVELSSKHGIPLHPRYTYHWRDISLKKLQVLVEWLKSGVMREDCLALVWDNPQAKRVLEVLGVPHQVEGGSVYVEEYLPLLSQLGFSPGQEKPVAGGFDEAFNKYSGEDTLDFVKSISSLPVLDKSGTYIGARMGRPEKARERRMQPPVHSLFPIGRLGGRERNINVAAEKNTLVVDCAKYLCPGCQSRNVTRRCPVCDGVGELTRYCSSCGRSVESDECPSCGSQAKYFSLTQIDLKSLWRSAIEKVGRSSNVKAVQGMISEYKIPEPIEKGLLRAVNDVYVFKDGTIRFDATDAPLTHFKPREVD
ncbi:MAG: DNA polymerase II large subunit, partial [Candidatus Altiarchaeales archaeon]|nr:DNA polymerase II large subunit [Candidatus Altiarchaeales archaeon]